MGCGRQRLARRRPAGYNKSRTHPGNRHAGRFAPPERERRNPYETNICKIESPDEKQAVCLEILRALPAWFGIPASVAEYGEGCRDLPFWAARDGADTVGFAALRSTSRYAAELYVMGVLPGRHRGGLGRALFEAAREYAAQNGFEYLQVKTVAEGHYPEYDRTNAFYRAMGFHELEVLPLWDAHNPCQLYVMRI